MRADTQMTIDQNILAQSREASFLRALGEGLRTDPDTLAARLANYLPDRCEVPESK